MAWLTINGIEFSVEVGSTDWTQDLEPTRARTVIGEAYEDPVADKGGWSFRARLGSPEERRALRRYLVGATNGHVWSFDSGFFSSKGLETTNGSTDGALDPNDTKFGGGAINIVGNYEIINLANYDNWTVAGWHTTNTWSTDTHYLQTSDDDRWTDGGQNNSASLPWTSPQTSTSTDQWTLTGTGTDERYDDLLFFPFIWPDRWAENFDLTTAHSKLPHLDIDGDFHDRTPLTATLAESPTLVYPDTGGDQQAAIDFALREV